MGQEIELRDNHAALLRGLIEGKTLVDAAKAAGMGDKAAWSISRTPRFQVAMREALNVALITEGAPVAYAFLSHVVKGSQGYECDIKTRVVAAKTLLGAVVTPPKAGEAPGEAPDPGSMSTQQLRDFVASGERELANRAVPVNDPEPGIFG